MAISFRAAVAADEPWLFRLHEDTHRVLVEAAYGPWIAEQQRDFFRSLIGDHQVFIVKLDDVSAGAVYLGGRDNDTWLELIEIVPSRQGNGVGSAALKWVVATAAKSGREVRLQVHRINDRARRLYLREGFTEIGTTETHHILRSDPPR